MCARLVQIATAIFETLLRNCILQHGRKRAYKARMNGKAIAALRKRLGMTPGAFAKLLKVDKSTVSRWEAGKSKPSRFAVMYLKSLEHKDAAE